MKKLKILIVSLLAGSGHKSTADSLKEIFVKDRRFRVVRYDHSTNYFDSTYNQLTKYSPFLHNMLYHYAPTLASDMLTLWTIRFVKDCLRVYKVEKPDIIISTHFVSTFHFKVVQWVTNTRPLMITVYPDHGCPPYLLHAYNIFLRPEYMVVFDKVAKESLIKQVNPDKKHVLLWGRIPKKEFVESGPKFHSKLKARDELKLMFKDEDHSFIDRDKTTVLIASGGGGIIHKTAKMLKKIVKLNRADQGFFEKKQFFVICGSNVKFYNKIIKYRKTRLAWQNIFPFSWLSPEQYSIVQAASDYPVLFGVAPSTLHELLYNKTGPILIHEMRANHEIENVKFIVDNHMGEYIKDLNKLMDRISKPVQARKQEQFLRNSQRILKENKSSVKVMPEELYKICSTRKFVNILDIYHTGFMQVIFSAFLTFTLLFAYYFFQMLSLLGIFAWPVKTIHKTIKKMF